MTKLPNNKETDLRCPKCSADTKLIVKTRHKDGRQFLGCSNWPDCSFTREIPEDLKMRLLGYKRLL